MKKLTILKIDENQTYWLKDEEGREYNFTFQFYDLTFNLEKNDYIYINNQLLDKNYEGYSKMYTFGCLESKYGTINIKAEDIDIIRVEKGNKHIYLKRLYG